MKSLMKRFLKLFGKRSTGEKYSQHSSGLKAVSGEFQDKLVPAEGTR